MALQVNGTTMTAVNVNGTAVNYVVANNTLVFGNVSITATITQITNGVRATFNMPAQPQFNNLSAVLSGKVGIAGSGWQSFALGLGQTNGQFSSMDGPVYFTRTNTYVEFTLPSYPNNLNNAFDLVFSPS